MKEVRLSEEELLQLRKNDNDIPIVYYSQKAKDEERKAREKENGYTDKNFCDACDNYVKQHKDELPNNEKDSFWRYITQWNYVANNLFNAMTKSEQLQFVKNYSKV